MSYAARLRTTLLVVLLTTLTAGLASAQTPVTSVIISDKAGVTTTNYPMTLSMIFKEGDVADHVYAKIGTQTLTTQTDAKVHWPDGTVMHALVSFLIPTMSANGQVTVDLYDGGTNANSTYLTKTQLLATDFDARMTITPDGGSPTTITARDLLNNITTPEYWIKGDVCSEFLIRHWPTNLVVLNPDQSIRNKLNVQYYVRYYPGWNGIRIDTVVENCWAEYRSNITYDFDLKFGNSNPQTVLARTALKHNMNARWHRIIWQGDTPPEVEIRFDVPYMISTGLIPNYDLTRSMSETEIETFYQSFLAKPRDIMEPGIKDPNFKQTGTYEGRPIYGDTQVRWLRTMDNRMREVLLNWGDSSGAAPIHYRESNPNKSDVNHILTIDDRPTVCLSDLGEPTTTPEDRLPFPTSDDTHTEWDINSAHTPSFTYLPYIATGEFFDLEELYFWPSYELADFNNSYRSYDLGIVNTSIQTRGMAWVIRNMADAAMMAPDGSREKTYFMEKTGNTLTAWQTKYLSVPSDYPAARYFNPQWSDPALLIFQPDCAGFTSPWMDDFMLISLAHMKDCGFTDAGPLVDWIGKTVVDRFHNPDFNWYRGNDEWLPVKYRDAQSVVHPYPTWAAISAAYLNSGPTSYVIRGIDTYQYIARCALSNVTGLTGGQAAWDWYDDTLPGKEGFDIYPGWDCVPRGYVPAADTIPPSAPYNMQVTDPTVNSLIVRWTAPGDNGLTGTATSYDLRYSTNPITTSNWGSATPVPSMPTPTIAGYNQYKVVSGLDDNTTYYFAMTASDEVPNVSDLSSCVSGTTLEGVDVTAPATIANLKVDTVTTDSITLSWTTPGDDGMDGTATHYDIRYSTVIIDGSNWDSATQVTAPTPAAPTTPQSVTVGNLTNGTTYYFAMKTSDEVPNTSALSNVVGGTTIAIPPVVQFTASSSNGSEGTTPATITVTLDKTWPQTVVVNYAVTGGTATEGSDFSVPATGGNAVVALKRDATLTDWRRSFHPVHDAHRQQRRSYDGPGCSPVPIQQRPVHELRHDCSGYWSPTLYACWF